MAEIVPYSEKDLFDLAEQVLLGKRDLESLGSLDEDDLARVQAAVRVGPALWADEGCHAWEEAYSLKPIEVKRSDGAYVYVPDRSRRDFLSVSRQFQFPPLSTSFLLEMDDLLLTKLCEAWSRDLGAAEVGILLRSLAPAEVDRVLDCVSERQSQEWEHLYRKRWDTSQPGFEEAEIQKRASLIAAEFLLNEQEVPASLIESAKAYLEQVEEQSADYLKGLPDRMGVVGDLQSFSDRQWSLLAGFTPREAMVQLAFVLDKSLHEKLVQPLPERQKPDLSHSIAIEQQAPVSLQKFHDRLQAYKRWVSQIVKVQERSSESE